MRSRLAVACSIVALTLLGFFEFPGHTYLHSDTQIYVPMLEHTWDRSTFPGDLVATKPHLSYTLYDEIAIALGISKSGASVAARDLERVGVVHRLGTPGSKRVLYEATDEMESTFTGTFARVRDSLNAMQRAQSHLGPGKARRRMKEMVEVHEFWLRESTGILDRWRRRRQSK